MWFDERGHAFADALVPDQAGEAARRWAEIHGFTPGTSLRHVLWFHSQPEIHDTNGGLPRADGLPERPLHGT